MVVDEMRCGIRVETVVVGVVVVDVFNGCLVVDIVVLSWCGINVDVEIMVDVWVFVELTMVGGNVDVVELVEIRVGTSVDVG